MSLKSAQNRPKNRPKKKAQKKAVSKKAVNRLNRYPVSGGG
jgi:hypothetical protein